MQTDIPDLVDIEQVYRKFPIVASSDINSTRPNRIPVLFQDKRSCTRKVFTKLLAGVQASWLTSPVEVNPFRTIFIRLNGLFYECSNWLGLQLLQKSDFHTDIEA